MRLIVAAVILTLASLSAGQQEDPEARLLISKNVLNNFLVEGKDLTVEYKIFNVGGGPALDVHLKDSSFPAADFDVVRGNLDVTWERIGPGANVTHAVILQPTKYGYFNFTSAEVSYHSKEDKKEQRFGYTSAPGEGGIVNRKEFDRRFSPHVLDWLVFAVMTLPSLGIPCLLWYSSSRRFAVPPKKHN
ncbi:hypothetical protein LOTGIDRAFT_118304 [Lottia gigantea]|uniref:Translocon-associated protein subunit beta n=1 Tax=Lottia gigantea TaxID=225164 RepID=V3ZT06_LOTGI|nr:hypothetical protein LOTGIDRAFT_118304 [Lottia gigantea]ESO94578.1 hypothetical protein LOTGIDRAFT_118304 [Lottia gigantea]